MTPPQCPHIPYCPLLSPTCPPLPPFFPHCPPVALEQGLFHQGRQKRQLFDMSGHLE